MLFLSDYLSAWENVFTDSGQSRGLTDGRREFGYSDASHKNSRSVIGYEMDNRSPSDLQL